MQSNHHYNFGMQGQQQTNMNKKPLNNYNPNLSKKNGSHSNQNILNRPGTSNAGKGPVKIRSDVNYPKKPSTPDQFGNIKRTVADSKMGIYQGGGTLKRPSSSKTKNNNEPGINHRPSTAPQKEKKNTGLGGTMIIRNSHYSGPNKRLPSPQLHSNGLGHTQKINPSRYRAPSPVIKSGLNMGGTFKRGVVYPKNKFY